jgi:hypothetical protein
LGTSVAGGNFDGTGLSGYAMGASGQDSGGGHTWGGATYLFNGTSAFLTQGYSNMPNQIYYATNYASGSTSLPTVSGGSSTSNHIATGSGVGLGGSSTGVSSDWVHGIGTLAGDSVSGGAGNDYIGIVGTTNSFNINGGGGWNTLVFENVKGGGGMSVDLGKLGLSVQNIDQFDLSNELNTAKTDPNTDSNGAHQFVGATTGNTLIVHLADVIHNYNGATTPNTVSGGSTAANYMTILGDANSTVKLDSGWSKGSSVTMTVTNGTDPTDLSFIQYHNTAMKDNHMYDLLIQSTITPHIG